MKKEHLMRSFLNAAGTLLYVTLVAWLGFNSQQLFGHKKDSFLDPLFVLLLFVVSASITGFLVLGKPLQLYWDNQKKEAFALLFATVGWLVLFLLAVGVILATR